MSPRRECSKTCNCLVYGLSYEKEQGTTFKGQGSKGRVMGLSDKEMMRSLT